MSQVAPAQGHQVTALNPMRQSANEDGLALKATTSSAAASPAAAAAGGGDPGYFSVLFTRLQPCFRCSNKGFEDEGDTKWLNGEEVFEGEEGGKNYQDLGLPVLMMLGVQHLLAVIGSVVVQALLLARAGVCEAGSPCDLAVVNGVPAPPGEDCQCYIASGSTAPDHIVFWTVFVSGLCTALQSSPIGPLTSNLLSIMGTSSAFISVVGITGRAAMPGKGVQLVMGMNMLTFWAEPMLMYALPDFWIGKLLDPTVKGTVVMVIGLTLTARVGVKLWTGDGGGVDLIIGLVCVISMARLSKTKRYIKVSGVKIYLKSVSLLLSILIGWPLYILLHHSDSLLAALDDAEGSSDDANCTVPTTGYTQTGYGYDFRHVNMTQASLAPDDFSVRGLQCAPGRVNMPFSGPNGDCACGDVVPCACPCTVPGEPYIVAGCEILQVQSWVDFPGFSAFDAPGPDGKPIWISLLIPWFITRIAATLESVGDITATAKYSGKASDGPSFDQRLRGGLNMDALSGFIASLFGSFPLTTMSQNNGLIRMSGLHDWRGGLVAGSLMMLLAPLAADLNPPMPVMGGCLTVIYATIAMGGIAMLTEVSEAEKQAFRSGAKASLELPVDKPRTVFIVAASVGLGLGAEMHAYGLNSGHTLGYKFVKDSDSILYQTLGIIFESGIATSTLMALLLSVVWPDERDQVRRAFKEFDTDNSGSIDGVELKVAMRRLGLNLSDEELQAMMSMSDSDGNGSIDLGEFEQMIAAINRASEEGSASWNHIRSLLGGSEDGSTPLPRGGGGGADLMGLDLMATVMGALQVSTWLVKRGLEPEEAEIILRGFAEAEFALPEWQEELNSMSNQELEVLVRSARRSLSKTQSSASKNGHHEGTGFSTSDPIEDVEV